MFKSFSFEDLRLGIDPESMLSCRSKTMSLVKLVMVDGILPLKELKLKSNTISEGERTSGILPEKLFDCRNRERRDGKEKISVGMFPLRLFDRRLKT